MWHLTSAAAVTVGILCMTELLKIVFDRSLRQNLEGAADCMQLPQ